MEFVGTFGVDDYSARTIEERFEIDGWLQFHGILPLKVQSIRIEDNHIIVNEYYLSSENKMMYDRKTKEVATTERMYRLKKDPPFWKE